MSIGHIKLDRKILEWEWYKNINTKVLFIHMLLRANWKDGKFEGVDVPRGSFVSSLQILASETSLTVNEVRTAILHLKTTGEITSKSHRKFTVFSIKNYGSYQDINTDIDTETTGSPHSINTQLTTIEEVKKSRKKEVKNKNINYVCPEQNSEPPIIALLLNDKSEYPVTKSQIETWTELYPSVDILQQLRNMKGWLESNPTRRKTRSGVLRFITAWLSKEQNKGGVRNANTNEFDGYGGERI